MFVSREGRSTAMPTNDLLRWKKEEIDHARASEGNKTYVTHRRRQMLSKVKGGKAICFFPLLGKVTRFFDSLGPGE